MSVHFEKLLFCRRVLRFPFAAPTGGALPLAGALLSLLLVASPPAQAQPASGEASGAAPSGERPNIVFIMADDLGYGDVASFNPEAKVSTPHIDRLAAQGRRFTDAHAPGSWCTPTRYGLLTGSYPFRDEDGMRAWTERSLIEPDQATLASLLKERGYATAMVGKWHLGFEGGTDFDCSEPLEGGPTDRGFDSYFGLHTSLDIPPYFYIRNGECVASPSDSVAGHRSASTIWNDIQGAFWRAGNVAPGFRHAGVLPRLREEAVAVLEQHRREVSSSGQPLFLYLALTAPHTPWLPLDRFQGTSGAGSYGDFVAQTDAVVGEVLSALERLGMTENTLVVFTSDNGPVWFPKDRKRFDHRATDKYRGMKGDAWEGGHRMPFVARWPGRIQAGSASDETISFVDMMATFAAITGSPLPEGAGPDSYNVLPAFLGNTGAEPIREALVHDAVQFDAIRQGPWKLIRGRGSGGFINEPTQRDPEPGEPEGQLYNLAEDPREQNDLYAEYPQVVDRLSALMGRYKRQSRSRPTPGAGR